MTIELNKDEKAPYSGVLLTEPTFRSMWIDIRKSNDLKTELQSCLDRNKDMTNEITPSEWIFAGFMAGALSVIVMTHFMK